MADRRWQTESIDDRLTRRRLLAAGGTLVTAGVGIGLVSGGSRASVTMGELSIPDKGASVTDAPGAVPLTVSGQYRISAGETPEQARTVLQVEYDGTSDDLDENVHLDSPTDGSYTLEADLLTHRALSASALVGDSPGATTGTQFTIRVILLAVSGGEIQAEAEIEDTATLSLTNDGMELRVGGEGSISVEA